MPMFQKVGMRKGGEPPTSISIFDSYDIKIKGLVI